MKRIVCFYLLIAGVLTACGSLDELTGTSGASRYKGEFYFPSAAIDSVSGLDTFKNRWYSYHLNRMNEPILHTQDEPYEVYRYTNLGTWSAPYTYRIENRGGVHQLTFVITSGQGGYHAGSVTNREVVEVSIDEWKELHNRIDSIDFWNTPVQDGVIGLDGSEWILEGYKDGKYHVLTRWTPDSYGDPVFVRTCRFFSEIYLENQR